MSITDTLNQIRSIGATEGSSQSQPANAERLKSLAAQFESMLVGQMMQQMRSSMFDSGEEGSDNSTAPLADALFSELSLALSRSGGLGLADSMLAPLTRQAGAEQSTSLPAGVEALPPSAVQNVELPIVSPSVAGRISSAYGWRQDPLDDSRKFHKGVDIALPVGHDVPAPMAGTVVSAGDVPGYGLTVVVDHGNQLTTRYAHLSQIDVAIGEQVQAGQVIAKSGATGRVTGPHLHFEVMEAGQSVNPQEVLPTYTAGQPQ